MTKIEINKSYRLGSYADPERSIVTVKAIDPDAKAAYDDHQGGYTMTRGSVLYLYEEDGGVWQDEVSLEYAMENWESYRK